MLDTFYRDLEEKWIAQPCLINGEQRFNTALEAQQEIIERAWITCVSALRI
ncbi:hypothetical protein RIVM261_042260 [Rivularia sp. IAM M-261]|nr:hypothetical protein RIVM261_042260 [Rivularia sp. IAM M-261]